MSKLPSGTIVFLITDIEGSTRLWDQYPKSMQIAIERHNTILMKAIKSLGGHVFKVIGDEYQAAFTSPLPAIEAALDAQRTLIAEEWGEIGAIKVRMGIHVGPGEVVGDDYASHHTLNRVARISGAGHGGQILLSHVVADMVRGLLPEGVYLRDMGEHTFKGLSQPEHIYQVVAPGLPQDFPPLKSLEILPPELSTSLGTVRLPAFLEQEEESERLEPVFVARKRELGQLDIYLDEALAGKGQVAFITGGPGIGKTALFSEFTRRSIESHPDLVIAIGRCNAYSGTGDPFLPFRDIFSMLVGDTEEYWSSGDISREHSLRLWENRRMMIKTLFAHGPDLINVLVSGEEILRFDSTSMLSKENFKQLTQKIKQQDPYGSEMRQSQLFEQCLAVLKTAAKKMPIILILDDLHWADAGSLSLLFHLGKRITKSPILIIGTYRPATVAIGREESSQSLDGIFNEFKRVFGDIEIDLRKVQSKEKSQFVNAYIDVEANKFEDDFRSALLEHTEGHPLFTVELLRDMQDRGDITQDKDKQWVVSKSLDWSKIPVRLEGVIGDRLSRLDEKMHKMLEFACVEGHIFTAQVIAELMEIDEYQVLRILSWDLEKRHNLVQEMKVIEINGRTVSRYKFSHILFQTYLYNKLSKSERLLLHENTAGILEKIYEGHLEEIASSLVIHFDKVGNVDKTIHYLQLAGERALKQFAYQEVIDFIGRSLSMMPKSDANISPNIMVKKARGHIRLGQAFQGLGIYTESKEHLNLALKLLDRPIPVSTGKLIFGIVRQIFRQIMHRLFPKFFLNRYPKGIKREILLNSARAYSYLGDIYFIGNETLPTIYIVLRTLNLAERADPSQKLAEAYALMCIGTGLVPLHQFARWYRGQAEEVAREINHPSTKVRVAFLNSVYNIGIGRWADVAENLENAMIISENIGDRRQWEECVANLANNALLKGDVQQSKELFEALVYEARRSNNMLHLVWGLEGLANHKLRSGETYEAAELLKEALYSLSKDVDKITKFEVYGLLATAHLRLDKMAEARETAESALNFLDGSPTSYSMFQGYSGISEVYMHIWERSKDDIEIRKNSELALQAVKHFFSYARIFPIGKPMAYRFEGIYYWLGSKHKKAANSWMNSLDAAEQLKMPYEIGLAHFELGSHEFGEEIDQTKHMELARLKFDQLGVRYR